MKVKVWFDDRIGEANTIIETEPDLTFRDFVDSVRPYGGLLTRNAFVPYRQIILIERIQEENEPIESAPTIPNDQA